MERLKKSNKVVGLKQTMKMVSKNNAEIVYIAEDADSRIIQPLVNICVNEAVEVIKVKSMKELAKACKVEVPTACAAILKGCDK